MLKNIILSFHHINLIVGERKEIQLKFYPKECLDNSVTWKTSDKTVAIIEISKNGKTFVKATGVGGCYLICIAKKGKAAASCKVIVRRKQKKKIFFL